MKAHSRHGRARGLRCAAAFGVALAGITALIAAPVPATSPVPSAEPSAAPPAVTAPPSAAPSETPSPTVENSVVKVFSTLRLPDPYRPWTKQQPSEVSGSGAIIGDKRILTNAHVVLHASQVQVQANQAGDRISATIEAIAPGIDLAILKVDDETLFDSRPPLRLRKTLPDAKEQVMVYGYPTGGSSLSITKGIISRIEFTSYSSSVPGVRIQIDAAINPGNSGGPAIVGDEMVGLAFSRLGGTTQNIGYIIPCEEIELFLKDAAHVEFGKPAMYDDLQTLENPALRPFLHIDRSVQGMIVHRPFSSSASYPLKEWDIITKIGETPIDNEGMVKVSDHLRMRFQYLIQKIAAQDKAPLTVIRDGKTMKVDLPLLKHRPLVIPDAEGKYPPYFIYGPLVLSEATTDFLTGMRRNTQLTSLIARLTYEGSPLVTRVGDRPAFEGERLVVVSSPFFPHKLAKGYGNPAMQVVKTINAKPVKNLAHAVELLRDLKDEFVSFTFDMRSSGETIVFPRAEMAAATEGILTDNGIREEGSPDLLTIWRGQKGR
jgi:S1-C subfamily serine protease